MAPVWRVADLIPADVSAQFPELHPVILQLLWNKGLRTTQEMDVFLHPDWNRDTFAPSLFTQMPAAVARIFAALERREIIAVHGDYDADGVCGSAVLISTLRELCRLLGFNETAIIFYLPHREKEGYGFAVPTMEFLARERKAKLIITVDCGISNKPAIDRGKELGVDTIVCDHHALPVVLPMEAIILHPLIPGETYPNKGLCGTGVAFKLASALIEEARGRGAALPEGQEKWLLDLVAIATVTDVMPLIGENRALETYGLLVLNKKRRLGIRKLMEAIGTMSSQSIDTTTVGFQIGPRLNAAGRMDHANAALALLLAEENAQAIACATKLQQTNTERQQASDTMFQQALALVGDPGERKLIIACGEGWPAGLVGLIASKLVGEYRRPVLVVGHMDGHYVGSGRSVPGFDVTETVRAGAEHLDKFGGHPQACGFSVRGADRFARAAARMSAYAETHLAADQFMSALAIEAELLLEEVDWDLQAALARCEPFGEGNRRPVFASRGLLVTSIDTVGGGKHLRLTVRSPRGTCAKTIGFRLGAWASKLKCGDRVDIAYEVGMNEWKGRKELQWKIVDLNHSSL